MDLDGHIKLIDFGLSKENMNPSKMTSSFCGSPEYMSPEMLNQHGHGLSVDVYSLGVVLYELVTGLPPHYSSNQKQMIDCIIDSAQSAALPRTMSMPGKFLISSLLIKSPENRLGSKRGIAEIKEHPWCEDCSWDLILAKKVQPPYVPCLYGKQRWMHISTSKAFENSTPTRKTTKGTHAEFETAAGSTMNSQMETPKRALLVKEAKKYEITGEKLPLPLATKKVSGANFLKPKTSGYICSPPVETTNELSLKKKEIARKLSSPACGNATKGKKVAAFRRNMCGGFGETVRGISGDTKKQTQHVNNMYFSGLDKSGAVTKGSTISAPLITKVKKAEITRGSSTANNQMISSRTGGKGWAYHNK